MLVHLFITILNWSMIASYVIVGVLVMRILLRKAPTVFSYALWGVVLVRLVTPFSFEAVGGLLPQNTTPIPLDVMYSPTPEIHTGQSVMDTSLNHVLEQVVPRPEYSINPLQVITIVGSWIWVAGIVIIVAYNIVGLFKLHKRLQGAQLIRDNIYRSEQIDTPFVMGVVRPKIYLVAHLTADEEAFIIQHEQYHIRRWDHLTRIVAFIALTLHWFNPLVWVAFILSDKDMECACDEAVMHQMGTAIRADYSHALLRLATGKKKVLQTRLAFGEGDTKKRVKNIMMYQKPMTFVCILAVLLVGSLSIGFMSTGKDKEEVTKEGTSSSMGLDEALPAILADWKYRDKMVAFVGIDAQILRDMEAIVSEQVAQNEKIRQTQETGSISKEVFENNEAANKELRQLLGERYALLETYVNRWWTWTHYNFNKSEDLTAFLEEVPYPPHFAYQAHTYANNELTVTLEQSKEETWSRVLESVAFNLYDYMPHLQRVTFITSLPAETVRKVYDRDWYNNQMGYDEAVTPPTTEQFAHYEVIYDYLWEEIYAAFSPIYDVDRIEVSDYEEREGASYLHVTMYNTHYNRDPDTVGYIAALKEAGDKHYQQLYDEYLGEHASHFNFKAIVDANEGVTLYTDVNPTTEEEWVETQIGDYVLDGGQTEQAPIQSESIAGYIVFGEDALFIDTIEIITLEDAERMEALGLTSEDLPNGYYFNNPSKEVLELPLGLGVTYDFTDSGQMYEKEAPDRHYVTTDREAFFAASAYQEDLSLEEQRIPYHVSISEGKVCQITETFLYTQ